MKTKLFLIASILLVSATSCKKKGCTDSTATNYSEEAKKDDNSCVYAQDVFEVDPCENYTASFEIQTPNKGSFVLLIGADTYFRILGNTSQTDIDAIWYDTSQKKYSATIQIPTFLNKGEQVFSLGQFTNGVFSYTDEVDTLNSFTYVLQDSLTISITELIENSNNGYYKPIEATFSGKYKYWGYTASGQTDTALVNLTGSFNLCGSIE